MEPQNKNKIPPEYQEAFQFALQGDNSSARSIVFPTLEEKLSLFGLALSFAIFCLEDPLGYSRWLKRASKILEDNRHAVNKSVEQEVLDLMESFVRCLSLQSMLEENPDRLLNVKNILLKLEKLLQNNISDERSVWIRLIKLLLILDVTDVGGFQWEEEDPVKLADELIKYDPDNAYYWYLKEKIEFYDDFETALKLNPKLALAHYQRAKKAKGTGYEKTAITLLDKAIAICPRFADAHLLKAQTLQKIDIDDDGIMNHMDIAIDIDPDNAEYYYKKGYWLVDLEEYEDAIKFLNKTLELEPLYGAAYNNIAYTHIQQKNFEEAIRAYLKAVKTGLEFDQNLQNITRALNDIQRARRDDTNIRAEVIQVIKSLNVTGKKILKIASFLSALQCDQDALDMLEKIEKPSLDIQIKIGMILKSLGRYQESIQKLQAVADAAQNPLVKSDAYTAIGWIYANKLHNKEEGLKFITEGYKLDPQVPRGVMLSVRDTKDPNSGTVLLKLPQ